MKTLIGTVLLVMGMNAMAMESEPSIMCDKAVTASVKDVFDLWEGKYNPDSRDNSYFCAEYAITNTDYAPCSGNIKSLTLTCVSDKKSWSFSCSGGVCTNSDGSRTLEIDKDFSNWAKYTSNGHKTVLRYSSPCD